MRQLARRIYDHILFKENVTVKQIMSDLNLVSNAKMRSRVIYILRDIGRESKPVYDTGSKKVKRFWVKKSPKGAEK